LISNLWTCEKLVKAARLEKAKYGQSKNNTGAHKITARWRTGNPAHQPACSEKQDDPREPGEHSYEKRCLAENIVASLHLSFLALGGNRNASNGLNSVPELSQNDNPRTENHREGHEFHSCRFRLSKERGFQPLRFAFRTLESKAALRG
jgi:hypothetical protein